MMAALIVLGLAAQAPEGEAVVPGGLRALSFVARGKPAPEPDQFFVDYSRAILQQTSVSDAAAARAYQERIRAYFRRLSELESAGERQGDRLRITLAVGDRPARSRTEKIVNLLGWRTFATDRELRLEIAEKTLQSSRKETATALEIDEIAMQEALQAGRPFSFQVAYERAPVLLGEAAWRSEFFPNERLAGGLAEALARQPQLAKLYVALSALDASTQKVLLEGMGWKALAGQYGDLFYQHASAFGVVGGRAAVPGGERAEGLWAQMAGARPGEPARFYKALFEKDQGWLLTFFAVVSRFDFEHQRFVTRDAGRLRACYELFRQAREHQGAAGRLAQESPLVEVLRQAPLDAQGRIRFPGGAAAWDGGAGGEEEIIQRLARADLRSKTVGPGQLAALLAVVQLEGRRGRPLEAGAARLLARHHREFGAAYPYFRVLTELTEREFGLFFAMGERLGARSGVDLNVAMGQWHALTAILCLGVESGAVGQQQAAQLFGTLCERFLRAATPADWPAASADVVRGVQRAAGRESPADEAIREMLLGEMPAARIRVSGAEREIDTGAVRRRNYQRVLELQHVPSLQAVLDLCDAARAGSAQKLEAAAGQLAEPETRAPERVTGRLRANLDRHRVERLRRAIREGSEREALEALGPQMKLALTGILYAYYLDPDDLLIEEDPLLLRKHQFVELAAMQTGPRVFLPADLQVRSESMGSFLKGGFADFAAAAGAVALAGTQQTESYGEGVFLAQIGRLREAAARRMGEQELREAAAQVQAGREWIEQAGERAERRAELAEATLGVLSLNRRAALLEALGRKDWRAVWRAAPLADLRRLGARRKGAQLPAGARAAPYEEYERYLMPHPLAAAVAEFPVYLAEYAQRQGWPAAATALLAEPMAQELLRELPMSDVRDWRSVLEAFSRIDDQLVERVLEDL